jgi:MbtH protein
MNRDDKEDDTIYKGVVNHEEQYSIWPADRGEPAWLEGYRRKWLQDGMLAYIKEVWTDMRPLSLRKKMEKHEDK